MGWANADRSIYLIEPALPIYLIYQSVLSRVLLVTNSTPLTSGYRRLMSTIAHDAMPFLCLIGPTYCRAV